MASAGSTGSRPEPLRDVDDWLAPYRRGWVAASRPVNALERHLQIMGEVDADVGL